MNAGVCWVQLVRITFSFLSSNRAWVKD
jgi:hypothetical protein